MTSNDIIQEMKYFLGEDGLIIYCLYMKSESMNKEENQNKFPSKKAFEHFYQLLNSNKPLPEIKNRLNYKLCCLFFLSQVDKKYLKDFQNIMGTNLNSAGDEKNYINMIKIFDIIHYINEYFKEPDKAVVEYSSKYLETFKDVEKEYIYFILFEIYSTILTLYQGEYTSSEKRLKSVLTSINVREDKINANPYMKAAIKLAQSTLLEVIKKLKTEEALPIKKFAVENFASESHYCLPILESMIKENEKDKKVIFALASRIGYIGLLTNESEVIKESIKEVKEIIKEMPPSIEDKDKFLWNFILSILNYSSTSTLESDSLKKISQDILPLLSKYEEENKREKNNYFTINLSNIVIDSQDNELKAFVSKINPDEIIKEFKQEGKKIDQEKILSFIFTIHSEISRLSEEYYLEQSANKKGEVETKIISYAKSVLEYVSHQEKTDPILNKPLLLGIIIEIYSSLIQIYIRKKDKNEVKNINEIFQKIKTNFIINEKTPSYGFIVKIEGDIEYSINDEKEKAEELYKKAIEFECVKPIAYFNLGIMQYLQMNTSQAIPSLKTAMELLRAIHLKNFPYCTKARKEMIKSNYSIINKILERHRKIYKNKI